MEIILLGGKSAQNQQWLEDIKQRLAADVSDVHLQVYDHWSEGGNMELSTERPKLKKIAQSCEGDYCVFAKSAGVLLALDAIRENDISPNKCVFVGSPVGASAAERFDNFRTPTLFIQQADDPIRPAEKVQNVLKNHNVDNYTFLEVPGGDHVYDDLDTIIEHLRRFLDL